jgi:hypothetical protein
MIKVKCIAFHRNGVGGAGFNVVEFVYQKIEYVAVVFEEPGYVAVLNQKSPALHAMRGDDDFGKELRAEIAKYNEAVRTGRQQSTNPYA